VSLNLRSHDSSRREQMSQLCRSGANSDGDIEDSDSSEPRTKGLMRWIAKVARKVELPKFDEAPLPDDIAFISNPNTEWTVQLSLYERSPTSPLSQKEAAKLSRVELGFTLCFDEPDAGYFPLRGGLEVRDSRFFRGGQRTFWIADDPGFFKFTLNVESVQAGGKEVLPAGRAYFNAKMQQNAVQGMPFIMQGGVVTIKQDVKASFMGQDYSGILAEYIVVGTFSAQPSKKISS